MKFFIFFILVLLSLPGFTQEDDDKLIEQIEEHRRKQGEVARDIEKVNEGLKDKVINFPEELKKLGYQTIDSSALMNEKVISLVQEAMAARPMKNLSKDQVRSLVITSFEGKALENVVTKNPLVLDILVEILRDEKAIPKALGLFLKKKELKIFAVIWIGLILLGWLFKKIFFNKRWSGLKTFVYATFINLVITCLVMISFYYMFSNEISPLVDVIYNQIRV